MRAVYTETESVCVYTEQIFVGYYIYIIVAYKTHKNNPAHIEGRGDYLEKEGRRNLSFSYNARMVYRSKFFVGYYNIYIVTYKNLYMFIPRQNDTNYVSFIVGVKNYVYLYRKQKQKLYVYTEIKTKLYVYTYYSYFLKRKPRTETESVCVYTEQIFVGYYIYIIVAYKTHTIPRI